MDKLIATIPKNTTEEIRIELGEYRGYDLVSIRVWAEDQVWLGLVPVSTLNHALEQRARWCREPSCARVGGEDKPVPQRTPVGGRRCNRKRRHHAGFAGLPQPAGRPSALTGAFTRRTELSSRALCATVVSNREKSCG